MSEPVVESTSQARRDPAAIHHWLRQLLPGHAALMRCRYAAHLAALLLGCTALAGCGHAQHLVVEHTAAAATTATGTQTIEATATSSSSDPAYPNAATGTVSDQRGDRATLSASMGEPQPLADVHEAATEDCTDAINEAGQSVNSAIAIPVQINVEVTSATQVPLAVSIGVGMVSSGGFVARLPEDTSRLFASSFGSGPQCGETDGEVVWTAEELPPHTAEHWHTWIVILNAATPHDPSGDELGDQVVMWPEAVLEDGFQNLGHGVIFTSGSYVTCSGSRYVAADMATAQAGGCKGK